MKIVIEIPKEFEDHFNSDRFEDSLARIASDIESFGFRLAGRYEKETITMLREAFKKGTPLPEGHGRLIDADYLREDFKASKKISFAERMDISCIVDHAPTIIEADRGE